ncbi:hypothetical protein [Inhella gelatinilytica]|uniref:Uncharacterized protein n=1 Tax=Inhella gelatinilytica TaxID=2795030 RepID=A0A931ITH0_9BURK|nr:hypothetical protein [Inhella gelatinilytica]MBH9551667.1 hypothetical protein [Inhella gelatinilytica]
MTTTSTGTTRGSRLAAWGLALLPLLGMAQPLKPEELPKALQDWLPWAWHGHLAERCPKAFDGQAEQPCVWPGHLSLKAEASGASFRMELQVLGKPAHVALPGEAGAWPQDVKSSGEALAVTEIDGRPAVWLTPGRHTVEGRLTWRTPPQDLQLPAGLGSLEASLSGQPLRQRVDANDRLLLSPGAAAQAQAEVSESVRTVRQLDDDIPARLITQFGLTVSGPSREITLPLALLPGWQAQEIRSPLPARLQSDGSLRVQARPGQWQLELEARHMAPLAQLALPAGGASAEEVWSFAAQNALRVVSVSGGTSVDPRQVEMPEDWRRLPAYRLRPGEALQLAQTRRGTEQPEADALNLHRTLWLDFDGGGFSVQDRIEGQVHRATRLDMPSPGLLGRASVNGAEQTLTQGGAGHVGFALRDEHLAIQADSRISSRSGPLPASGWAQDFESLQTELRLPPGWFLLHASGVDRAEGSWIERWTLWDLFFWLLGALAAGKLLGWRVGLLTGAALGLAWHLPGSPPQALWLALMGLLALRQVLPAGHGLGVWVARAQRVAWVVLALGMLRFGVDQVHFALHPQLETQSTDWAAHRQQEEARRQVGRVDLKMPAPAFVPVPEISVTGSRMKVIDENNQRAQQLLDELRQQDPRARVQTGPGLPNWSWTAHALNWQGPVQAGQTLSLWLLPPGALSLLRVLAVLLLVAAALPLARGAWPQAEVRLSGWRRRRQRGGLHWDLLGPLALLLAAVPAAFANPKAQEGVFPQPSDALLTELRARVNPPPPCLPRCAELARGLLVVQGGRIQLRLEVHAQAAVALPLPGEGTNWRPERISLDGQPAPTRRDEQGQLWLLAPAGVSQVLLEMDAGSAQDVGINLPLPLRELKTQLDGWALSGLDARGLPSGALRLARELGDVQAAKQSKSPDTGTPRDALPPLVRVERQLQLGLQWSVTTRVQRVSPSRAPVGVQVALLPGEAITEAGAQVREGVLHLQLGGEDEVVLTSMLKPLPQLDFQAGQQPQQIEVWSLAASPAWQVQMQGLAPIWHQREGRWSPQWQPWPGDRLQLRIAKPAGAEGQTLTLDTLRTEVAPGRQASSVTAHLSLRASLGQDHRLQLPPGAELLELRLNDAPLPVQARDGALTVPLTPGRHELKLRWRQPEGLATWFRSPALGLGPLQGVNERLELSVPQDRVALAMGISQGPTLGPAVLFWGVLLVLAAAVAFGLRKLEGLPLQGWGWLLLGLGVAPASLQGLAVILGWFLLLRARERLAGADLPRWQFNGLQLLVLLWTVATLSALTHALSVGLLGHPNLLIQGNGSHAHHLAWYADRVAGEARSAWLISLPIWAYRVAMLLWALWLAAALLGWVRWAWGAFSAGGLWRGKPVTAPAPAAVAAQPPAAETLINSNNE